MNNEIKEILENIKCPQLGYDEYGKWGALPLNVRMTLKRLCDYVVSCDDYITNLQQIEQEKEDYKSRCEKAIEYINKNKHLSMFADCRELEEDWNYDLECSANDLLNILQGENNATNKDL